jgi:hypothetical protein
MFDLFKTKLWKIGNHRIKKDSKRSKGLYKFRCIDCEKCHEDRERFKDEECYTVIYD